MSWYYAEGGSQIGPVSETEFEELVRVGKITPDTLVWREGMATWRRLAEARPVAPPQNVPPVADSSPNPAPTAEAPKEWYYEDNGKQAGPVNETELNTLVAAGRVTAASRVWRQGMANWQPYGDVRGGGAGGTTPGAGEIVCAECRNVFPRVQAIQYGTIWVCAGCKPNFLQNIRAGAALGTETLAPIYAGFWIRFAAKFVDGMVMSLVTTPIKMMLAFMVVGSAKPSEQQQIAMVVLMLIISFVLTVLYNGFFVGKYGATPGKMACKIQIVRADGQSVGFGLAFGRCLAEMLSGCPTLMIGYIIAAFDDEKRALHDRLCNTRVVYK